MANNSTISPKQALILGAFWTIATRWSIKCLGFLNTVIMARLLLPSDYGLVAMAMLIVGLIQALLDFGATTALLRKNEITRDEIDSAWTLKTIQGFGIGLILITISPLASIYYQEPRVIYVLWVLAICLAISGLSNIGLIIAQKEFNFSIDFKINILSKIFGVTLTISSGYLLRDYRALVIGIAAGYSSASILSYCFHPYRPRWNTKKIGEIWRVTKWLMLAGVGGFFLRKTDELIAARLGTTADYGLYNVGSDLGQLPTVEIGPAMLKAFLPVLASMKDESDKINSAVLKTLGAVNTITLPVGFGFAALSIPATHLILGTTWGSTAQYVSAFAIASSLQIMSNPLTTLLIMRGHTSSHNKIIWLEFITFSAFVLLLTPQYYLLGLAYAKSLGSIANFLATAIVARVKCSLSLKNIFFTTSRPLLGAVIMHAVVTYAIEIQNEMGLQLIIGVVVGIITFFAWSVLSWLASGKPTGLETITIQYITEKLFTAKKT